MLTRVHTDVHTQRRPDALTCFLMLTVSEMGIKLQSPEFKSPGDFSLTPNFGNIT